MPINKLSLLILLCMACGGTISKLDTRDDVSPQSETEQTTSEPQQANPETEQEDTSTEDTSVTEPSQEPTTEPDSDNDGDGFTTSQGDCNDNDPIINPNANDEFGNGIDENCDGFDGQFQSLLYNGGFEEVNEQNSPMGWMIYPQTLSNYMLIENGIGIYDPTTGEESTTELFTSKEGNVAIKVWGQHTGSENETPIYQEFPATEGETFRLSGSLFVHDLDQITAPSTSAFLWIKFFDDNYQLLDSARATPIIIGWPTNQWMDTTILAIAPVGTTKVQCVIAFYECEGESSSNCSSSGAVYFDDVHFGKYQ